MSSICSDEWEWLKRINSRHKSLENLQSQVREVRELESLKGTEQQQMFVEQVANTARRLFSYMDVSMEDAMLHRSVAQDDFTISGKQHFCLFTVIYGLFGF